MIEIIKGIEIMELTHVTPLHLTHKLTEGNYTFFYLHIEYIKQGMLFGLDKDIYGLDLEIYINGELISCFASIVLIYIINSISLVILLMEESNTTSRTEVENAQTTDQVTQTENNVRLKPTINIVYSKVNLDTNMYFVFNKNEGQYTTSSGFRDPEDYLLSLLAIKGNRLKKAEIEVDGKLYNGVLRRSMAPGGTGGFKIPVKPTAYRRLVETHNLESDGRNLICYAGSVVIYANP